MLLGQGDSQLRPRKLLTRRKTERKWQNRASSDKSRNGWTFHLFTLSKYLTFESCARSLIPFEWFSKVRDKRIKVEGRKERVEARSPPCRKFATLTRRRCGKTHKKTSPKNRRRSKWRRSDRTELEESGWQITKFVLLFASSFSGHESSRLLNPKEKISLWYYSIKIRMLLLSCEICDKCSIHSIFQITRK